MLMSLISIQAKPYHASCYLNMLLGTAWHFGCIEINSSLLCPWLFWLQACEAKFSLKALVMSCLLNSNYALILPCKWTAGYLYDNNYFKMVHTLYYYRPLLKQSYAW